MGWRIGASRTVATGRSRPITAASTSCSTSIVSRSRAKELHEYVLEVDLPGVGTVWFASLEHLRLMEEVAGRPRDVNDPARLDEILET